MTHFRCCVLNKWILGDDYYKFVEQCTWVNNEKFCKKFNYLELNQTLPSTFCGYEGSGCNQCILGIETRIINSQNKLIQPKQFLFNLESKNSKDMIIAKCVNSFNEDEIEECNCKDNCTGDERYCAKNYCVPYSPCRCTTIDIKSKYTYYDDHNLIMNPKTITYPVCLYNPSEDKNFERLRNKRETNRKAHAEGETHNNKEFGDEIFELVEDEIILSRKGRARLVKDGVEYYINITNIPMTVQIPDEFYLKPGSMKFSFTEASNQKTRIKTYYLGTYDICMRLKCYLCLERFKHFSCIPSIFQFIIVCSLIIFTSLIIQHIKRILKFLLGIIRGIYYTYFVMKRICKGTLRISYVIGSILGFRTGEIVINTVDRLQRLQDLMPSTAVLLLILKVVIGASALKFPSCNDHHTINTQVMECEHDEKASIENCVLKAMGEITLKHLDSTVCLYLKDTQHGHITQIRLTYSDLICEYHYSILYYTFPVDLKMIIYQACPEDSELCHLGDRCYHRDFKLTDMTPEVMQWPGISSCQQNKVAKTFECWQKEHLMCNLYHWYLVPHYERTYRVHRLTGQTCKPRIILYFNGTGKHNAKQFTTGDPQSFADGKLLFTALGNYDQPINFVEKHLVTEHNDPTKGYLETVCAIGRPKAGDIGEVQASTWDDKNFTFDTTMARVTWVESFAQVDRTASYLERMPRESIGKLPMENYNSIFQLTKSGKLIAKVKESAPLIVSFVMTNVSLQIRVDKICPVIHKIESIIGCYTCETMAIMKIKASSYCNPGLVTVTFNVISTHTQTIELSEDQEIHEIQVKVSEKCVTDKICLIHREFRACEDFEKCFDEPIVKITHASDIRIDGVKSNEPSRFPALGDLLSWFPFPSVTKLVRVAITIVIAVIAFFAVGMILSFKIKLRQK